MDIHFHIKAKFYTYLFCVQNIEAVSLLVTKLNALDSYINQAYNKQFRI